MGSNKITHFPSFSVVDGRVSVKVDLSRFGDQIQKAQFWLDGQVMNDMVPFMPFRDGILVDTTRVRSASMQGTGKVCAGAPPYGRFLYEGKVMVDPETGSAWARPGARKVVTETPLNFDKTAHPSATDHWFDAAKSAHVKEWVRGVKKIAGNG